VLSVTLDLRMGELSGVMNICYPFQMVQPLLGKLSARIGARRDGLAKVDRSHEEMLGAIGKVPLDLHAVIGRSVITTDQLANLKVGDLIRLDRRIDQPIEVQVADRPFFSAEIGRRRNKAAIRLLTSQFNLQGGNGAEGAKK